MCSVVSILGISSFLGKQAKGNMRKLWARRSRSRENQRHPKKPKLVFSMSALQTYLDLLNRDVPRQRRNPRPYAMCFFGSPFWPDGSIPQTPSLSSPTLFMSPFSISFSRSEPVANLPLTAPRRCAPSTALPSICPYRCPSTSTCTFPLASSICIHTSQLYPLCTHLTSP